MSKQLQHTFSFFSKSTRLAFGFGFGFGNQNRRGASQAHVRDDARQGGTTRAKQGKLSPPRGARAVGAARGMEVVFHTPPVGLPHTYKNTQAAGQGIL